MKGGSPAYQYHVDEGFLSQPTNVDHVKPLTYLESSPAGSYNHLYQISGGARKRRRRQSRKRLTNRKRLTSKKRINKRKRRTLRGGGCDDAYCSITGNESSDKCNLCNNCKWVSSEVGCFPKYLAKYM